MVKEICGACPALRSIEAVIGVKPLKRERTDVIGEEWRKEREDKVGCFIWNISNLLSPLGKCLRRQKDVGKRGGIFFYLSVAICFTLTDMATDTSLWT